MHAAILSFIGHFEHRHEQLEQGVFGRIVFDVRGIEHILHDRYRIARPEVHRSAKIFAHDQGLRHLAKEIAVDRLIVIHPEDADFRFFWYGLNRRTPTSFRVRFQDFKPRMIPSLNLFAARVRVFPPVHPKKRDRR